MSVFISYNFDTGKKTAEMVSTELARCGIDTWWISDNLKTHQLDEIIERVLSTCQRGIIIWSTLDLSEWQRTEIEAIRQRLLSRRPVDDPTDFFMILRHEAILENLPEDHSKHLPLLEMSEYIDYTPGYGIDLSQLIDYTSRHLPLIIKDRKIPQLHPITDSKCALGKRVITGTFKDEENQINGQNCWVLLVDTKGLWYVQQPRPTFTHAHRWIAPSIYIGQGIVEIILIAASHDSHRIIVNKVLAGEFSGCEKEDFGETTIIDRLKITIEEVEKGRGFHHSKAKLIPEKINDNKI